jgi:hypothetical protein
MKLTREQFEKRTKDIEEKEQWILDDLIENKKNYKKEEFVESREKNIFIFLDCGLPYELILEIFSYCDISTCVKFGLWERAIMLSKLMDKTPSDFETVQFFHYFKSDIRKTLYMDPKHCIKSVKFLYYIGEHFNIEHNLSHLVIHSNNPCSLVYYSTGVINMDVIKFLLERCECDTTEIRRLSKRCNKEMYKYVYDNPTPWDLQLSCNAIKKNGCPCLNKANFFGYCGVHRFC